MAELDDLISQFEKEHGHGGEMSAMDADSGTDSDTDRQVALDDLQNRVKNIASGWSDDQIAAQIKTQQDAQNEQHTDTRDAVIRGLQQAKVIIHTTPGHDQ